MQLRWHQWIALLIYRLLFTLLLLSFVVLFPLWIFSPKRRMTLPKRLGWQNFPEAPPSHPKPIWIHALSIGELLSARTLIEQVQRVIGDRPLYLSVSTLSAFVMATDRFKRFCNGLFYFPYDFSFSVKRCLDRVDPALFVLIETDIWPGFLAQVRRRQIPCLLVNGRISPQSFRSYALFRILFQPAFNTFRWVYPQSSGEGERFCAIGLDPGRLRGSGNLKFDVALSIEGEKSLEGLRQELHLPPDSRLVIAGSTHPGEEDIIRSCFLKLRNDFPGLRLILAPRRPERGTEVSNLFRGDGFDTSLLSHPIRSVPTVVVVDRLGYLSRLYALAEIAIVGGSFVPRGGQNPIEPAACGKPVLFGLDMRDFPDVSRWLLEAGGAVQVRDEADLYAICQRLLSDPQQARLMGNRARQIVTDNQGATLKIVHDIVEVLDGTLGSIKV